MFGWLSGIKEGISNLIGTVTSIIKWLADTLLTGIKNILQDIFVPTEDYLTDKVDSIREKFSFADSVIGTVSTMQNRLSLSTNSTPPTVTFNLSSYEGKFDFGQDVTFSMAWFSRYKPTTDSLLSGILWLTFVWKVFVRLPSIINGVSSASGDMMKIDNYDVNDRRTWGGHKA